MHFILQSTLFIGLLHKQKDAMIDLKNSAIKQGINQ